MLKPRLYLLMPAVCCLALSACRNPQQDWETARLADTREAYTEFLEAHPQGDYAGRARTRIAELEREEAWERAQRAATAPAYESFLNEYPDGAHSREARDRLQDLERQAAWEGLLAREAPIEDLRDFAAAHPGSAEAQEARELIASLEAAEPAEEPAVAATGEAGAAPAPATAAPPEPPAASDQATEAGVRVQLGAFRTEEAAQAERERLQQDHGQMLGAVVVEPAGTEPPMFRVRSGPMTRASARETCTALEAEGQACIVVDR